MFRFRYLDGLRGWAALVVVVDHFFFAFAPSAIIGAGISHNLFENLIHSTPLYLFVDGDFSVAIFFVLSGLVLSAKFFRTGNEQVVIASGIKRYFRLAVPVLCSVILAFVLLKYGLFRNQSAAAISGSDWFYKFWQFAPHPLAMIKEGLIARFIHEVPSNISYNPVLWTMQIEFLGSFLVFLTLLIFGKIRHRSLIYLFLILLFWKTFYLAFILGVVISDFINRPLGHRIQAYAAKGLWLPILSASLFIGSYPTGSIKGTLFDYLPHAYFMLPWTYIVMHVIGAAGVVVAIMCAKPIQSFLTTSVSLFLGRISFSLYLTHFLILGTYTSYLFIKLNQSFGYRVSFVMAFIPTLVLALSVGYLYARLVDEKAISLSGTIYRSFFALPRQNNKAIQRTPSRAFIYGMEAGE